MIDDQPTTFTRSQTILLAIASLIIGIVTGLFILLGN
jgi:hypothetical protein